MPHGYGRDDMVDEERGSLGHAPPTTARAEAAPFAGERNEAIDAALGAGKTHEAVSENAALEVAAQLTLDEARDHASGFVSARDKVLDLVADDLVKNALFGPARAILPTRGGVQGGRGLCHPYASRARC